MLFTSSSYDVYNIVAASCGGGCFMKPQSFTTDRSNMAVYSRLVITYLLHNAKKEKYHVRRVSNSSRDFAYHKET